MEETDKLTLKLPTQEIDYFKIGKILLSRWYWILGSVLICMMVANIYLWYSTKKYTTTATMKLEEKKSEISEITGIATGGVERTNTSRIQSETIVLQSTPLLMSAIKTLDYRISFFVVGRVLSRTSEIYPRKPLDISLIKFDSLNFSRSLITFKPQNENSFFISYKDGVKEVQRIIKYDTPFSIGPTILSIKYPAYLSKTSSFLFRINNPEDFIPRIRGGFHTSETAKNSNIISLQETDSNPQFAADILNAILKEYLNYDRNQKIKSSSQMINFIDSQLDFLSKEVKASGNSIKDYKNSNKILDVSSASESALTTEKQLESQKDLLKIQLIAIDQLKQQVIKEKNDLNLNFFMKGIEDPELSELITKLVNLLAERADLLKTYTTNSQQIIDENKQILDIKVNVLNSIDASRSLAEKQIKYIDDQLLPVNQQISSMPSAERDLVNLKRDFDINDKVYSFLSEKKLDAQINSAGMLPGATIIDVAQPNHVPVSPDDQAIHRSAIIFGLVVGIGLIILIRVVNPYIYDRETIESLTSIPIIGVIRQFPQEIDEYSSQILAISKPKSVFAESVRSVRTNLSFLASEKDSKVMCVTSEVAGEGKSFVAVNLSSTLSLIDKKVILIAADLRRSKLHKTFNVPNDVGLSNYLANQCELKDIIFRSGQENLDFIVSGPVPPNPSELLHNDRMASMIILLKSRYDVVMFDTAPIGLVSDAIPLIRSSDINIFVVRSGKSKYYAATIPQRIALEYHLDNTVIVLNAYKEDLLHSRYYTTKLTGDSYGTRYYYYSDYSGYEGSGYYVNDVEKKWWNIKNWIKK